MKGIDVDINPTLGRSLRGPGAAASWDFEPGLRLGFPSTGKLQWSLAYYGSTGDGNVVLNVGVGLCATDAGNTAVFKTRLGWIFK